MALIRIFCIAIVVLASTACQKQKAVSAEANSVPSSVAESFAYPVGQNKSLTEAKDSTDEWYNATDFGEANHLGEDWNKNSGGNTDCGEPVYSIGNGTITYADYAGASWGNVVIVEHTLPDGKKVESLYGHLKEILKTSGEVKKGEQIGSIGNADGKYLCHLHLEIRDETCPLWGRVGPGYGAERNGWLNPSEFIDKHRGR